MSMYSDRDLRFLLVYLNFNFDFLGLDFVYL